MADRIYTVAILGVGSRGGNAYGRLINKKPEQYDIVSLCDIRQCRLDMFAPEFNVKPEMCFLSDDEFLKEKRADLLIIATQDKQHLEPALAFGERKYDILIEKPLAPTLEECRDLIATAEKNDIILSVCHVLRYTNYTRKLKELIDGGAVGKVMSVQHLEPVGHWRFAHSYVRGNWRKEAESSSVLLAKSIHDLDWICYIVNSEAKAVSSFGSLMYFKKENQPQGAADRCLDCTLQDSCPYAAPRFYLERIRSGNIGAYVESVSGNTTEENILKELRTSPYGRCVFACDNDVVDHQVVNMEFEGGVLATFTMSPFNRGGRKIHVMGTEGEVYGDAGVGDLTIFTYQNRKTVVEKSSDIVQDETILGGHGGGDSRLIKALCELIATGETSVSYCSAMTSARNHLAVFAAEEARHTGTVVDVAEYEKRFL